MPEKIFITGAAGFVGSNLARRLVNDGNAEIHILTRENSNTWRISDILDKIHNHQVDILDAEKLKKIINEIQPDYIFHLANAGLIGGVSASDEDLVKVNLVGLINLISALENVNYKGLVNVGSSSEYGLKSEPMKETDFCEPMNPYGVSKLAATCYASFVAKFKNKPIITFRLFSPFGLYDDFRRLVSKSILDLLAGKELNLANPEAVRDYIFIDDVVDLFLEAKDKTADFKGEIFNLGSGRQNKISEVVDLIIKFINPNAKVNWGVDSPRAWESKKWEADINKTFSNFNWRPKFSLEKGIEKTIDWFRENKNLYNQ